MSSRPERAALFVAVVPALLVVCVAAGPIILGAAVRRRVGAFFLRSRKRLW